jgi:hypothetical protein
LQKGGCSSACGKDTAENMRQCVPSRFPTIVSGEIAQHFKPSEIAVTVKGVLD